MKPMENGVESFFSGILKLERLIVLGISRQDFSTFDADTEHCPKIGPLQLE
jgi:hypothetical protein